MVKAELAWMVELLQALAWAVKVEDTARTRVSRKSEMRDFILAPEVLRFSGLGPRESARVAFCGPVPSPTNSGQALHRWRCSGSTPQLEKSQRRTVGRQACRVLGRCVIPS